MRLPRFRLGWLPWWLLLPAFLAYAMLYLVVVTVYGLSIAGFYVAMALGRAVGSIVRH